MKFETLFTSTVVYSDGERCRIPAATKLQFDSAEPLAVTMVFNDGQEDVEWVVGRELLASGIHSEAIVGTGDIRFRIDGEEWCVLACLRSPYGHADIALPLDVVRSFLDETREQAEQPEDCITAAIDEALKEILGS